MRSLLCLLCCLLLQTVSLTTRAQDTYVLNLHRADSSNSNTGLPPSSSYNSAASLAARLHKLIPALQEQGYLAASIDSIAISGNRYEVYLYSGRLYQWARLNMDEVPQSLFTGTGIDPKAYTERPMSPGALGRLCERLLDYCDANGYPFARVWLDSVYETTPGKISAQLNLDRAELRKIDTVIIEGNGNISRSFLLRYLDLQQGSIYNEKKLRAISQRIQELPFLKERAPWHITPGTLPSNPARPA
jgi:hypothetical protein